MPAPGHGPHAGTGAGRSPPASLVSGKARAGVCRVPSAAWGRPEVTGLGSGGGLEGGLGLCVLWPLRPLRFSEQRPVCFGSEDQDELHCQDTDSDVPEQRDGRCKVKWTQEEVSESLALAEGRCLGQAAGVAPAAVLLHPSPRPLAAAPARVVSLLEKAVCLRS